MLKGDKVKVIGKIRGKDVVVSPEFLKKLKEVCPELTEEELIKKMQEGVWMKATKEDVKKFDKIRKQAGYIEPVSRESLDKKELENMEATKKWVWDVQDGQGGVYTFEDDEHAHIMSKLLEIEQVLKKKAKK